MSSSQPLINYPRAVAEVLVQIGYGDTLSKEQKTELLEANRIALKYTLESNTTGLVLLLDVAPFRKLLLPLDIKQTSLNTPSYSPLLPSVAAWWKLP